MYYQNHSGSGFPKLKLWPSLLKDNGSHLTRRGHHKQGLTPLHPVFNLWRTTCLEWGLCSDFRDLKGEPCCQLELGFLYKCVLRIRTALLSVQFCMLVQHHEVGERWKDTWQRYALEHSPDGWFHLDRYRVQLLERGGKRTENLIMSTIILLNIKSRSIKMLEILH